jgi:2-oxoisovalerate dehydrogenase E2 component (dihydrolipoyl transacylase)
VSLYVFKLPDVGEGTAEAEVVAWHAAVGDLVEEDAPLVDVMTDKATVEITSPVRGRILSLAAAPGELATVGAPLVELEVESEETEEAEPPEPSEPPPPPPPSAVPLPQRGRTLSEGSSPSGGSPREAGEGGAPAPLAAPAVRKRAQALGIDLHEVTGSGPDGRVTHADLDARLARGVGAPALSAPKEGVQEVKVIGLRRRIAEKMQEAKRRIPHFGYVEEVDVSELETLRAHLNGAGSTGRPRLTLLPFLMRAVVRAAAEFPQINARYDDEAEVVSRYEPVHIGIATQTPGGLMVPVVRHAEARDLWDCAAEVARLAAAARAGTATREELSGSTITLTSLGRLGGISHFPVINAPEVAILGPNRIIERPVVRGGQVVVRKMMNLSSAFDHRVVDGHDAAEFIHRIKALLEHPATLFVS